MDREDMGMVTRIPVAEDSGSILPPDLDREQQLLRLLGAEGWSEIDPLGSGAMKYAAFLMPGGELVSFFGTPSGDFVLERKDNGDRAEYLPLPAWACHPAQLPYTNATIIRWVTSLWLGRF